MTDSDQWRQLAEDTIEVFAAWTTDDGFEFVIEMRERRDALLAAEDEQPGTPPERWDTQTEYERPAAPVDEHPPTFHVRPVWVWKAGRYGGEDRTEELAWQKARKHRGGTGEKRPEVTKNWRWGAREANGEIVIPESQALEHRSHAEAMAHRFADPLGAKVVVEGDDV